MVCGYRCRLRVAAMMATVIVIITQQITLYLSDQYYLRYHEFTKNTKNLRYMVIFVIKSVKSN